MAVASSFSCCR